MVQQGHGRVGPAHDTPFEGQGHAHDRPSAVHLTEAPLIAYPHAAVEGGVRPLAGHSRNGLDLDAWKTHGHQEHGQALVLGDIGVGPGQEDHPVGLVCHGGPHFLTVDHPLVAIADGLGGDGRHVRTMVGLAVPEAAVELTR